MWFIWFNLLKIMTLRKLPKWKKLNNLRLIIKYTWYTYMIQYAHLFLKNIYIFICKNNND